MGKLDTDVFKNKTEIVIKDFGHCDILDQPYNDYMHGSFSEGNENRELVPIYKSKIVDIIKLFMYNELSEENVAKYFNKNFSITGMPNAQFPSIEMLSGVYNQIRNNTYPFICSPYDFNILKFDLPFFILAQRKHDVICLYCCLPRKAHARSWIHLALFY